MPQPNYKLSDSEKTYLCNAIKRAAALSDGPIDPEDDVVLDACAAVRALPDSTLLDRLPRETRTEILKALSS